MNCLNELYKQMESVFKFCYRIIGRKPKNMQPEEFKMFLQI